MGRSPCSRKEVSRGHPSGRPLPLHTEGGTHWDREAVPAKNINKFKKGSDELEEERTVGEGEKTVQVSSCVSGASCYNGMLGRAELGRFRRPCEADVLVCGDQKGRRKVKRNKGTRADASFLGQH